LSLPPPPSTPGSPTPLRKCPEGPPGEVLQLLLLPSSRCRLPPSNQAAAAIQPGAAAVLSPGIASPPTCVDSRRRGQRGGTYRDFWSGILLLLHWTQPFLTPLPPLLMMAITAGAALGIVVDAHPCGAMSTPRHHLAWKNLETRDRRQERRSAPLLRWKRTPSFLSVIPRLEAIDQAEAPLHHALLVIVGGLRPPVSDHQVLEAVAASFIVDLPP
jgi:hypothetical protein